jgi:serine/threonine-protein kinase
MVVRFDVSTLTKVGGAIAVTEGVHGNFTFDASDAGNLVYVPATYAEVGSHLVWIDPDGTTERASEVSGSWAQPRISPDGKKVVVRKTGVDCELWLLDLERDTFSRLVQEDDNHDPVWAPDSRHILFNRNLAADVVEMAVQGSRNVEVIAHGAQRGIPCWWSGASDILVSVRGAFGSPGDIWVRKMDGTGEDVPFVATPQNENNPVISPDGRWIAYVSDETGQMEIYVRRWPDDGTVWQVSAGGGNSPLWSRDGSKLFYIRGNDQALMSVSVDTGDGLVYGIPEVWIADGISTTRDRDFDVGPDGRFITVGAAEQGSAQSIRILLNWPQRIAGLGGD